MRKYRYLKLNEGSARTVNKIKEILYNGIDYVKTWGIMTANNPMGNEFTSSENAQRNKLLAKDLSSSHLEYMKIEGHYGTVEESFFIINPSLEELERLSERYGQVSFIYAACGVDVNGVFSNTIGYYDCGIKPWKDEKAKERFEDPDFINLKKFKLDYQLGKTRIKDIVLDQTDANDNYSKAHYSKKHSLKFQVPFFDGDDKDVFGEIIEYAVTEAILRVQRLTRNKNREDIEFWINETTINAHKHNGRFLWECRGKLYR